MKDKEKQIKLLTKRISKIQNKGVKDIPNFTNIFIDNQELAEELLKYYQPKLPEDSVVLLRKEYEKNIRYCKSIEDLSEKLNNLNLDLGIENQKLKEELKTSKEKTEKIIMDFYYELFEAPNGRVITYDSFCKIAQKHNVEIPRETFTLAELEANHKAVEIKEN